MEKYLNQFQLHHKQVVLLKQYFTLIKDWNTKINLISFKTDQELIIKHFVDSLYLIQFFNFEKTRKVADLGTGGGFPGLALAILFPETEFALIDSTKKKLDVLEDIALNLKLKNIKTVWGRLEDLAHEKNYREKFDLVTARALAPLPVLLEYASGFVAPKGDFASYKGKSYNEELKISENAQKTCKFKLKNAFEYNLPLDYGQRIILDFEKFQPLDDKYPRIGGLAKNKSLI